MRKNFLILSAAAALVLVEPAFSFAENAKTELQALSQAKLSLTQAIETAEQKGGGKAIDAEFEAEGNASYFEVKVLGNDKLTSYRVDADTGQVTGSEDEVIEKFFTRLKPADVRGAQTTLAQAIGIAEQKSQGKALNAEVDREGDSVEYKVTVAKADGTTEDIAVGSGGKVVNSR